MGLQCDTVSPPMHTCVADESDAGEASDVNEYAAEAGFDFEVAEYEHDHEASAELLRAQLDEILNLRQQRTDRTAGGCTGQQSGCLEHDERDAGDTNDSGALLRIYDEHKTCEVLVIAFAALGGGGGGVSRHEFVGACRRAGCSHALFCKDRLQSWYLFGIGCSEATDCVSSSCRNFEAVMVAIEAELRLLQPSAVVMITCADALELTISGSSVDLPDSLSR